MDYSPVSWSSTSAVRFSALGALLRSHHDPIDAIRRIAESTYICQEPVEYWPFLVQWWSDHSDSYVVVETLRKMDI